MTTDVAAWVRVSTGGQDEQNQVPDIKHYCAANDYNIVKWFELHDKSASEGEQEKTLEEAVALAAKGKFKVLVCWAADRLERRGAEALFQDIRLFREAGARVESTLEPMLGADGLAGELFTAFAAIVAKAESARRKERVRIAHDRIDQASAFRGRIPYGYATEGEKYDKHLAPTAEGKKYVPEIYRRIAEGESIDAVAAWLTGTAGPRTFKKKGKVTTIAWWPKSVAELIKRTVYFGIVTDSQGHETHHCEALVDMSLWQRANDRLSQRPSRGAGAKAPAMLKGVLRCADCGGSMLRLDAGNNRKDGTHIPILYYRCYGVPGPQRRCITDPAMSVRLSLADRAVDRFMTTTLATVKVRDYQLVPGKNYAADIALVQWRLKELHKQVEFDDPDYLVRQGELLAELAALKALPAEPDTWEFTETDQDYGTVWDALPETERGAWLRRHRFVVTADRAGVSIRQEGGPWDSDDWEALVPMLPKQDALKGSGKVGHRVEFADLLSHDGTV